MPRAAFSLIVSTVALLGSAVCQTTTGAPVPTRSEKVAVATTRANDLIAFIQHSAASRVLGAVGASFVVHNLRRI